MDGEEREELKAVEEEAWTCRRQFIVLREGK